MRLGVLEGLKRCLSSFADKISKTELKPENIRPMLEELEFSLVASDVALPVAEEICKEVAEELTGVQAPRFGDKRSLVRGALRRALLKTFETGEKVDILRLLEEKRREGEPLVILFVGVNGTGKTTTIAKLAKYLLDRHYTVLLACSDTFRAGAIEQLGEHAGRLGVRMLKHEYGADPAAVAYDAVAHARARGINAVLIDTAGRMQTDKNLMEEVAKIKRVVEPDLTILTVDALTGNDAAKQAEEFHKRIGIDATILTKVDADVKGGAAISVTHTTKKPIIFIGTGQKYEDLEPFNPEKFVDMILGD
ncbi:signal recognition particle-docking protein FtsY [archaeon]|nr:MAG: signal recognition particle-docking protein FtsY [archaeon]